MKNEPKAIVIGAGCDTDLAVIRSLGRKGISIIIISSKKYNVSSYSKYVIKSFILEHPEEWNINLISLLLDNSEDWSGALLIPASDYSVDVLAKNKSKLSEFYIVAVNDKSIIEKCINKKKTIEAAINAGIPIPITSFPNDILDLEKNESKYHYPCILKPLISHTFCGTLKVGKMFKVNNFDELKSKFAISKNHELEMMVTQLIPGDCSNLYTYYAYRTSAGEFLGEFILRKLVQIPPDFGVIVVGESIYIEEIITAGRKFFNELSYIGLGAIEFKQDPCDGKFKLIEINARAGLGINLAIQSGVDFPWIMYNDKCRSKKIKIHSYSAGLKIMFLRDYIITYFRYHKQLKMSIWKYLKFFDGNIIYNNYDIQDFAPFLFGFFSFLMSAYSYLRNKFKG